MVTNTMFLCLQIEHMWNEFQILLSVEAEYFRLSKIVANTYINEALRHKNNALVFFISLPDMSTLFFLHSCVNSLTFP